MLNPGTPQNARNHEELNNLLRDINTLPEGTNPDDFENRKLVKISNFLKSESSVGINGEDFVKIIKGSEFNKDISKSVAINVFLKSESSVGINGEDFVKIIKGSEFNKDISKSVAINVFLNSERSVGITSKDFVEIIKGSEFKEDNSKCDLIEIFLKSERSVGISGEDFVKIIKGSEFNKDISKSVAINVFLDSERSVGITSKDFVEIIKGSEFKEDNSKCDLIEIFLSSKRSVGINIEDFALIIKSAELKDDKFKLFLINNFLKSERSSNLTPQDLAKIIKEVGLQNQADLSTNLYLTKFSESENFIDFTKALQPSEAMQCEFVKEFINKNQIKQNNVNGLKPFIEELQDNELALDIINNLSGKGILVNAKDTLSLVKNRSKKQYAFLTEIIGDKILEDCITSEGITNLKATFGEDLKVDNQLITVSDLISYYDMVNQTSTLFAMLKPEFKQQLRDNFSPSAEMLLYKPTELDKLNILLGQRGIEFDVKSYLIENTILSAHLKAKVGNISEIDSSKTYQINFTNFGFDNSSQDHSHLEKQVQTNALFNSLLQSQDPNKEEVAKFFSDLLGIDLSDDDSVKLKFFFQQNKKELAHCFCNENLPKENFESLFTTLRDGCFANIGTQFTSMLYGAMIKDEEAQILYGVMSSKIIAPIGANQDINHNGNPLDNAIINSYLLSPMALVTKTSQEEMLTNQKTWEIIGKNAGEDKKYEIYEKFSESYPDTTIFNQKAKEIASFLMVKNVVGEQRMTDLESKDPQLKELGDFVYDRTPEPSPTNLQQQDSVEIRRGCFKLSALFSCLRR